MTKVRQPKVRGPRADDHYVVSEDYTPDGCLPLRPGRTFRITGLRGQLVFVRFVTNPHNGAEWIDCHHYSPVDKHPQAFRSIDPSRIKSVSRATEALVRERI